MIQRIQSIFLLLAGIAFLGLLKLPFASSQEVISPFFEDKLFTVNDHVILLVLAILGGVIALANIFLFNNRSLQSRLCIILIILAIFLPALAAWLIFSQQGNPSSNGIDDGLGLFLPVVALIFAVLANIFIKKDDKLVKSMDRLR